MYNLNLFHDQLMNSSGCLEVFSKITVLCTGDMAVRVEGNIVEGSIRLCIGYSIIVTKSLKKCSNQSIEAS